MAKISVFFVGIFCFVACSDFIDVRPENSTTYTNYFRTQDDAEALLTSLMSKIRNLYSIRDLENIGSVVDDDMGYIPKRLEPYSLMLDWSFEMDVVYQANLILDNAHRFEMTEEELRPYLLQAYFAKGIAYLYLAMKFGEAPIIKESTTFEKLPQSSLTEVLDEAEKCALKAMELLDYETLTQTTTEKRTKQHGSKGAAAALLAHLYAWRAGVEGKSECWAQAEEYCRLIIEGEVGNYQLATDPEGVCVNVMRGNSEEGIWEICYDAGTDGLVMDELFVGFPVITTSDFTPENVYRPFIYKSTVNNMYSGGDKRKEAYFWATNVDSIYLKYVDGETVAAVERGNDSVIVAYDNQEILNAWFFKFRYPYYTYYDWSPEPNFMGMNQNRVVWRLAEIYLLRAECRARQGKANAVDDLNVIRRRAYGDDSHAFPCAEDVEKGLAGNIQLAIFREREKELLHEGHRYFDIVRNGWCYLRGEDTYDYIRNEISEAYAKLTDQDIKDGAMYYALASICFENNDLIRQNKYWNRRMQ